MVKVDVNYKVYVDHFTKATFCYLGRSYEFEMSIWKLKAFIAFQLKVHEGYYEVEKLDLLSLMKMNTY